jgi:peptidoglycan L-alanyl-D-glutamate endopeptidase CwlK
MIWLMILGYFMVIGSVGILLLSSSARDFVGAWPSAIHQGSRALTRRLVLGIPTPQNQAKTAEHLQPIWIGVAGLILLATPVIWVATRQPSVPTMDDESFRDTDPQVYALLEGEMLVPPPEVATDLIVDAEKIARNADRVYQGTSPTTVPVERMLQSADRKWDKINPRYVQRLLLVFKIMKQRYGYDLVLLEGYRSPERQNRLASMGANVTHATGYRSYHQFGLAGDVAFLRNGKVVITEKDPWAMQGYQHYGEVAESVGLTWGGRWKMMDLGHTEFRMHGVLGNADMAQKLTSESTDPNAPVYE